MKTNYQAHDEVYRRRKARGDRYGWAPPEPYIGLLEELLSKEYVPKRGTFLELGCGSGDVTLWMAEQGFEVYGVDIAPTAIEWAMEKAAAHGATGRLPCR